MPEKRRRGTTVVDSDDEYACPRQSEPRKNTKVARGKRLAIELSIQSLYQYTTGTRARRWNHDTSGFEWHLSTLQPEGEAYACEIRRRIYYTSPKLTNAVRIIHDTYPTRSIYALVTYRGSIAHHAMSIKLWSPSDDDDSDAEEKV